jgi:hypothetical protein
MTMILEKDHEEQFQIGNDWIRRWVGGRSHRCTSRRSGNAAGASDADSADARPRCDEKSMEGMKDMHGMMADPAMRQKMMTHMAQCRDMMSMMMERVKHDGKMADETLAPPKH